MLGKYSPFYEEIFPPTGRSWRWGMLVFQEMEQLIPEKIGDNDGTNADGRKDPERAVLIIP